MKSALFSSIAVIAMTSSGPAAAQVAPGSAADPAAQAEPPPGQNPINQPAPQTGTPSLYPSRDFLLGDFGGARTRLENDGLKLSAGYVGEFAYNPQGGERSKLFYAQQLSVAAVADMGKIAGLQGGVLTGNISRRDGRILDRNVGLGLLQQAHEIFGRGNIYRLSELSYAQDLAGGAVNVKLGRLDIGNDFNAFSCKFMNLTFCYFTPDHIAGDNFFAYPVSQWAARVKVKLTRDLTAKAGIYDINTVAAVKGFTFNTTASIGSVKMFELDWRPQLGAGKLPGIYHIGFWSNGAQRADLFTDVNGAPLARTGAAPLRRDDTLGFWLQGQQQVTGNGTTGRGLVVFANLVVTDRRVVRIDNVFNMGLFLTGLMESRPGDEIGFAVGRSHVSALAARSQQLRNATPGLPFGPVPRSEYPVELYYSLNFGRAVAIRPNVQYVFSPGGIGSRRDVIVVGLKNVVNF